MDDDADPEIFFKNLAEKLVCDENETHDPFTAIVNAEAGPSKEKQPDRGELALAYENLPPGADVAAWESAQSRSRKHVQFVRRRIVNRRFTKWQIEIRMPPPLVKRKTRLKWDKLRRRRGLPAFTDEEFAEKWKKRNGDEGDRDYVETRGLLEVKRDWKTDIEAEVARCVLSMIYDDYVSADWEAKHLGEPLKKNYGRRFIRFHGCRWLIEEQFRRGVPVPDSMDDPAVRDYVFECSRIFKEIAENKKADSGYEVPRGLELPVTEYIENGWRFERVYEDFWPDPKLNYAPSVNKRKAVGSGGDGAWIILEVSCESHPEAKFVRWKVPSDTCLCRGLEFRIVDADPNSELQIIQLDQC